MRLVCSAVLFCALTTGCGLCGEQVLAESASPDQRLVATVLRRDCGATAPIYTHVILRPAAQPSSDEDIVFSALHPSRVSVQWTDASHLQISFSGNKANTNVARSVWLGVAIRARHELDRKLIRK